MQTYRVGDNRAPQAFIDLLRTHVVTGENLDCWWVDTAARYVRLPDGSKTREKGCWVIWDTMKGYMEGDVAGRDVMVAADAYVDIFHLDGEWGLPTELGPWVCDVLNHSNPLARGNGARLKALNEMDAQGIIGEYDRSHKLAEEMAKDKFIQRIMQKAHDATGTPTKTKEDVRAEIAALEQDESEWRDQAVEDAKDMQIYPGVDV